MTQIIKSLNISNFRLFNSKQIDFAPGFNLIHAPNGCGKTTILEAVSFFGLGRSFKKSTPKQLVQHQQTQFVLAAEFAELDSAKEILKNNQLGVSWSQGASLKFKANQEAVKNKAEWVRNFPVQILNHQQFNLIEAGPQYRREFLDWGLFYVGPQFYQAWQQYQHSLKQRNAALKAGMEFEAWDQILATNALVIDSQRQQFLAEFSPILKDLWQELGNNSELSWQYKCGWEPELSFAEALSEMAFVDRRLRHTSIGPHRADLLLFIDGVPVSECLSRGQCKWLFCILHIAREIWLRQQHKLSTVLLIDDLAAELDEQHCKKVLHAINDYIPGQIILTALKAESVSAAIPGDFFVSGLTSP